MIFIILIAIGVLGIIGVIWFSSGSLRYVENPVAKGDEWFSVSPEVLESKLGTKIREEMRNLMKVILIWLIKKYRETSQKINLKQNVKKKVRAFLYDHQVDGQRNPSEFWNRVKHPVEAVKAVRSRTRRTTRTKKTATETVTEVVETPNEVTVTEETHIEENP